MHIKPYLRDELDRWDYIGTAFFTIVTYVSYGLIMNTKEYYGEPQLIHIIF